MRASYLDIEDFQFIWAECDLGSEFGFLISYVPFLKSYIKFAVNYSTLWNPVNKFHNAEGRIRYPWTTGVAISDIEASLIPPCSALVLLKQPLRYPTYGPFWQRT